MDNLTHALAGALICDALPYTKRLGPKAPLAAAIVAAAPDLDMVPAFIANFPPSSISFHGLFASEWVMRFHRAESHSLFLYALVFIPLAYAGWRWSRKQGALRQWALLVLLCLLSHTTLDLMNRYGVRAWLPFSNSRSGFGALPLMDVPILIIIGTMFLLNHAFRDSYDPAGVAAHWRVRTAAWLNHRISPTAIGMIGSALIAGRILWALATAPSLAGWF